MESMEEKNFEDFQVEENKSEECGCCGKDDKKIKNLVSAIILLAGLFIGSLFVDVAQLVKGGGYSAKNLNKSDIFEAAGKTWVAYNEPAVGVSVINDDKCEKCDVSEVMVWLRRILPTVSTEKVAYDSNEGKDLIEKYGIKTLPAFIFSDTIAKTDFFNQAKVLFDQKDSSYVLKNQELGLPAGKYLAIPSITPEDTTQGVPEAKVKVVIFSDFQCPYCKVFFKSLRDVMKDYSDRVLFAYKELPLDMHAQANSASLAALCAGEQGKFWEYGDKLYTSQDDWGKAKDTAKFKQYAVAMGLKTQDFNQCLDSKKFQEKIDTNKAEATSFEISGTPAVFVGDQFESGAVTADQLRADLDAQLSK